MGADARIPRPTQPTSRTTLSPARSGCRSSGTVQRPLSGVPGPLVPIFQGAAAAYNLGPEGASILAAINSVESNFDSNEPGVQSGSNSAGAAGPMQIGIGGKAGGTWDLVKINAPGDPPGQPPRVRRGRRGLQRRALPRAQRPHSEPDNLAQRTLALATPTGTSTPCSSERRPITTRAYELVAVVPRSLVGPALRRAR